MSKTASTKQLIELLQDFENKFGPSVVSDIVVRNELDRECEYIFFLSTECPKEGACPIHIPSIEYETFWDSAKHDVKGEEVIINNYSPEGKVV